MQSEYLYDLSCILRAFVLIIVKNGGGGVLLRPPKFVMVSHIDMIAR